MENKFPTLPLGNASITVQGEKRRFRVDTATLTPRGRYRVRLIFSGAEGTVEINLPRQIFWTLTSRLHEQSAAADFAESKPRRKRS